MVLWYNMQDVVAINVRKMFINPYPVHMINVNHKRQFFMKERVLSHMARRQK